MASSLQVVPEPAVLLAYSAACLVLFVTPGPDMSLFLARTLAGGRRAGLAAMAGANAGCCLHTLLAAFGLSALIAASALAFTVVKAVGAAYLLWLAVSAIRHGSALRVPRTEETSRSLRATFLTGIGINLTNPKVVLFFVTFLPQFVEPQDPHAAGKLVFLGLFFVALTTPLGILMVLGAERLVGFVTARPRLLRAIDYLFAGVFTAFALRIVAMETR